MLSISSTEQYDHWEVYFVQGVEVLLQHLNLTHANPSRIPPQVSALSEVLLNIAKELTAFLSVVSYLPPLPAHTYRKSVWQAQNTWLANNLASLRVECHRYSWIVLQIAITTENKRAAVERWQADADAASEDWRVLRGIGQSVSKDDDWAPFPNTSHSTSPSTAASMCSSLLSLQSSSEATSPTGSATSINCYTESGNAEFE